MPHAAYTSHLPIVADETGFPDDLSKLNGAIGAYNTDKIADSKRPASCVLTALSPALGEVLANLVRIPEAPHLCIRMLSVPEKQVKQVKC